MRKLLFILLLIFFAFNSYAQNLVIKGKVTDDKGNPLPGVTITLKETQIRTITNQDGMYAINLGAATSRLLVFTYISYKLQEVNITGKTTVDVSMASESKDLTEIVVSALNISRTKKSLGVAQQSVNVDDMTQARASNITDLLDGKVAGLQITTSGQTTGSTRVVLRGMSSITGNNQPLWVVDGVPIDNTDSNGQVGNYDYGNNAADLDPDDIASIEVLKGPNAAALYGSRAANGAILVTTKKGTKNAGLGISVNSNYMASRVLQFPDFQNIYGEGGSGAYSGTRSNNGAGIVEEGSNTRSWGGPMLGQPYLSFSGQPITYSPDPGNVSSLYQTGYAYTQNVAIANATDNSSIRFSYTRTDANDVVKNQNLQTKNNLQLNVSRDFTPFIRIDTRIQYLQADVKNRTARNEDPNNPNNIYNNLVRSASSSSFFPYVDPSGNEYAGGSTGLENPEWLINENHNEDITNTIIGGISATINIFKDLKFRAQTSANLIWGDRNMFLQKGAVTNVNGSYTEFQQNNQNWNTEGLFSYNKNIGKFSIMANAGGNIRTLNYYNTSATANQLIVHDVASLSNNASVLSGVESLTKSQTNSLYGTASVGYNEYLYVDVTGRNDWSSTLPAANRSFFYPSVSTSFIFSEFFNIPQNIMSFGKFRASIAQVGNDTSPYNTMGSFSTVSTPFNGLPLVDYDQVLRNSNLKPESTTSTELGLELKFLHDRISFDGSVYSKKTTNQILQGAINPASGYSTQFINAGEVTNKGIEISINATPIRTENFSWDLTTNASMNRNMVVSLSPGLTQFKLGGALLTSVYAEVGQPIGTIRAEDQAKDAQGNVIIQKTTGIPYSESTPFTTDGKATPILGNFQPKALGSFGSTFRYKSFDFNFLLTGRWGGQIFSGSYWRADQNGVTTESLGGRQAWLLSNEIYGEGSLQQNGTTTLYGLPYPDASRAKGSIFVGYYPETDKNGNIIYDKNGNMIADKSKPNTQYINPQTYWQRAYHINSELVFDDSYIKLTQVIIGYNVPKTLLRRTVFKSARVSLVGRNIWTILQNTPKGIDPESANSSGNAQGLELGGALPYATYGVDLKFSL
ncbi:SusC/RagA family TonB-linked outer membrane protein [Mucilaginibacter sp. X5P1]|uniref:SusC/RagA family TonB-linked outer membrane protein n=1 Tax=Mucilaginibacter sp. X5P1 TaxID=2723088 RepID=UPI00160ACA55|nr:SusC/RagA family TonB-linked outer membrane protein [Mucilaginibacter sp. X5P1]MBB6140360.1 TonB-linked SusC/RagA family outer membrane protein [Mucilaginibacter sp. X5P1]